MKDKKKLQTFTLEAEILASINEYLENNPSLTKADFFRQAIKEKLDRTLQSTKSDEETFQVVTTLEHKFDALNKRLSGLLASQTILEQPISKEKTSMEDIKEAIELLIREQPSTYEEAFKIIPNYELLTHSINFALQFGRVQYVGRKLKWN